MVQSKLGIHFTATSVSDLRRKVEDAKQRNLILVLNVAPGKEGQPNVDFAYDVAPIRKYIIDELEGTAFNWYTNQPFVLAL
jgi:hypothetical protein